MNNYMTEKTELPAWMCRQEDYIPSKDREAFLTKSTKSVLAVLAKLRFHEGKDGRFSASPSLKLFYTIVYIILTACSRNYLFVLIMCAAVTVRLAFFPAKSICQVLSGTAGAVLISVLLLLPAVFMGNPQTLANITARVYVSVTLVGILSAGTSWNKLTGSMRTFRIPSLFIFTLDITLKYISVLGEICIDILRAVGLRSVGKNHEKTKAFSGVLGITFLKSSEMAEEMYASMCCRGFTGEYSIGQKYKIRVTDIFYILVTVGCVGLFFYLNRGM
ncbi:energy-coupling factor transporter transmembrane component T family protein [Blautia intestinalis]|uniref:energy-coupling factor transporter transmembrane component T family protein n=1 Tax=Blautia intestinalis TaxID=2763028 RepID=UPI0022E2F039|nr:energy-coupling factor transporter transmembrane component T [Blautia intestinalis]